MDSSNEPVAAVRVTEYAVSCLPADHVDGCHFTIYVKERGIGLYAVMDGPFCLGADGDWEYEPLPSARTDKWKSTHRFPFDKALALAKEAAPHMTVNRLSVADVLKKASA